MLPEVLIVAWRLKRRIDGLRRLSSRDTLSLSVGVYISAGQSA